MHSSFGWLKLEYMYEYMYVIGEAHLEKDCMRKRHLMIICASVSCTG